MANKKLNQLVTKPSIASGDLFPIADSTTGQLYKTTISDLGTAIGSGVSSVNGLVGAVVLDTDDIQELTSPVNKWFTDLRARAAISVSSPLLYNSGTGLITIQQASGSQNGYLSSADWTTFNAKQAALSGYGFVKISGTTISYDNSTYLTTSAAASTYLPLAGGTLTGNLIGTNATFNGDLTISSTNPRIYLTDTDNNPDYFISNTDGTFTIYDVTASASRLTLNGTTVTIGGNVTVGSIIKSGGTSSQFLKADGSVDSTSYLKGSLTDGYLPAWSSTLSGGSLTDSFISYSSNITYVAGMGLQSINGLVVNGRYNSAANAPKIYSGDETTGVAHIELVNTGGQIRLGVEKSTGGQILPGSSAYATVLTGGLSARNLEFGTNNTKRLTIDGSTGAATFTSSVTASSLIKSGGTSSQFLKADGSVDSNTYLTTSSASSTYLPLSGGTLTGALTGTSASFTNTSTFQATGNAYTNGSIILKNSSGTNSTYITNSGGIFYLSNNGTTDHLTIASTGAATFSSSVTTSGNINANTSSASIQANGYQVAKYSYFGYSSGYSGVIIGNTNGQTLFFNVDVSGNPSGAFSGAGQEYVWRNAGSFITPNASNNGYNTLLSWNSSGNLTIPQAATFSSSVTTGAKIESIFSNTGGSIDNNAFLRLVNTGTSTLNQSIDIVMRWQDGTYNGTGGISMVRESATARSGKLILQPIDSSGNNVSALTLASTGAATFSSTIAASTQITVSNSGAQGATLQAVSNYADGYDAILSLNNTYTGGRNWSIRSTNNSRGIIGGGKLAFQDTTAGADTAIMTLVTGGNVGIGTTSPTTYSLAGRHLELNDAGGGYAFYHCNTTSVKSFYATNESAGLTALFTFSNHPLTFGTNNTERMRITSGGNVGINTTSPVNKLHVQGATVSALFVGDGSLYGDYSGIVISPYSSQSSNGNYGVEIRSTITQSTPSYLNPRMDFLVQNTNTYQYFDRGIKMTILGSGNVGIGTTSPSYNLSVKGSGDGVIYAVGASNAYKAEMQVEGAGQFTGSFVAIPSSGSTYGGISSSTVGITTSSTALVIATSSIERMRITSGGAVLVGTTSSGNAIAGRGLVSVNGSSASMYELQVGGTEYGYLYHNGTTMYLNQSQVGKSIQVTSYNNGVYLPSGGTAWLSTSDINTKTDLIPIQDAANKVASLRAVTGRYKTDAHGTSRAFLIAQDVQAVLPEAVNSKDGVLGLSYTEVIPLLVASIKELKTELDTLKNK